MSSNHAEEALMSYFGRVGYDYMGKYLFAFTFREDGYSRLLNKRWGFFPGVSARLGCFVGGLLEKHSRTGFCQLCQIARIVWQQRYHQP